MAGEEKKFVPQLFSSGIILEGGYPIGTKTGESGNLDDEDGDLFDESEGENP